MVAKAYIKPSKSAVRNIIIQPQFDIQLTKVLEFGIERFGVKVAHDFYYHTAINPKTIAGFTK